MRNTDLHKINRSIVFLADKNKKLREKLENEKRRSDFLANMCIDLCDHMEEKKIELPAHILKRMNDFILGASKGNKSIFDIIFDLEYNDE